MTAKEMLHEILVRALQKATTKLPVPSALALPPLAFEKPKNEEHGDYASNIAMILASQLKRPPREVAKIIVDSLDTSSLIKEVTIAGPGFINFSLQESFWLEHLKGIHNQGVAFGKIDMGKGTKVQVEFVSANPTGPLHIGHGRGAALGDSLAAILSFAGFLVTKEYYLNDVGNQMVTLGRSVLYRYRELLGRFAEFPENHYQGDYIYDVAREAITRWDDTYLDCNEYEAIPVLSHLAQEMILDGIKQDLMDFALTFDIWFSEKLLIEAGEVEKTIEVLKEKNFLYEL
jgi:arginyl-tRNA synthetase